jgi:hypothetical protein
MHISRGANESQCEVHTGSCLSVRCTLVAVIDTDVCAARMYGET